MGWLSELVEERGAEALDLHAQTVNPQFVKLLRTIGFDRRWARAQGAHLWDDDGNRYLDVLGGFGMFNVGRNNPRVREALVEALELERPGSTQLGVDSLPALLAEELLRRAPAPVEKVLFTSSGAESVEAALKLGRAATGRSRVLSAEHGFHGLTLGALSANAGPEFTERFGPLLPGFERVPWNDLEALERELAREDVALFLVEPVQGKGVNLPAKGYLEGAQELCRRFGTLFCVDEVQTGFGRTGRLLALEHWGLAPDLITVAKALSGGYVPVGALLMSEAVYEGVFDSLPNAVSHGSTFAPNDLAMVAGLATLRELDSQGLVERSARLGDQLLERTRPLVERSRGREGRARARADVGDRVRGARGRLAHMEAAGADPAGALRPARRGAALPRPPHPQPGRRPWDERAQGAAAARRRRGRSRLVRDRARRDGRPRREDAARARPVRPAGSPRRAHAAQAAGPRVTIDRRVRES